MTCYTSYLILPELKVILANFQGKIKLHELIQANLNFIGDKKYDPLFDVILDFRDSMAIAFGMDMFEYINFFKKSVRLKQRVKVGILYHSPNQKFLINVYKPLASLLKMDVGDYEQIDECLIWMGYSDQDQIQIKASLQGIKNNLFANDI